MIKEALIVGCGTMGQGIASLLALKGISVDLFVRNIEKNASVKSAVESHIRRFLKRNPDVIDFEDAVNNIRIINSVKEARNCYPFVLEAVTESLHTKVEVISEFSEVTNKETIWATNTSSLSVTEMASFYPYKGQLIGLHFFNPVASMELVEVIPSFVTDKLVTETCLEIVNTLGKEPVLVEDSPGFIVNRLLIPMINESIEVLQSGVATVAEIDKAMKLGAHHPLGPLALADLIGNDVCLSIMEALYNLTCDSKYRPAYLLRKMVSANKLGRKTKAGFYDY